MLKNTVHWLTLARAPPKIKKEKQQRRMRIRRIVSHAIRPAPSPPEASRIVPINNYCIYNGINAA
jgi:hypothetical protein